MLGAIVGVIVGSVYKWNNIKTKDFPLFRKDCLFTDDTISPNRWVCKLCWSKRKNLITKELKKVLKKGFYRKRYFSIMPEIKIK